MKYLLFFLIIFFSACKTQQKSSQEFVKQDTLINISAFQSKDMKTENERMQSILNSFQYTENSRIIINNQEYSGEKIRSIIDTISDDYFVNVKTDTVNNIKYLIFSKNDEK